MSNRIPTFYEGAFQGYNTLKEVYQMRDECCKKAGELQKDVRADHVVYCHFDLDSEGNVCKAWLYAGIIMSDAEFERVAAMKNIFVGVIHRLK